MGIAIVITALVVAGVLALTPRIRDSRAWKATVTPLSSIMGSGFLVSAPLVAAEAGVYAPLAMGALLAVAFAIGSMIRFNIRYAEGALEEEGQDGEHRMHRGHQHATVGHWSSTERTAARWLERGSHVVLAGAYVVSVSYYLQLLAAFVLDRLGIHDELWSRIGTSGVLALITAIGAAKGLGALEKVETYAVSLNLGMIAALLVGLLVHDGALAWQGELSIPDLPPDSDPTHAGRILMGLLIVVQGFETSRFLGSEHPAEERVKTMRVAQIVAAVIYLCFVTLMLPLLGGSLDASVTAIVGLVTPVAAILPVLIVIAAVGSQFSASVADDAGCAGLLGTIFGDRVSARWSYVLIGGAAIGITWLTDVFSIISLASRAFALFYALQCAVTAVTAYASPDAKGRWAYVVAGGGLAGLALSITVFGIPAE
ncbi:MAG: hypothetical protein KC619_27100 [Myxococcales bacterium]|nr:hypothetical protein [Myxococcales bacterium]